MPVRAVLFSLFLLVLTGCGIPFEASRACDAAEACGRRTHCEAGLCVPDLAPSPVAPPVLSGEPADGAVLTTTDGDWAGTPPFLFTYRWERCDSSGSGCAAIAGATGQTYQVRSLDLGRRVRSVVSAANAVGSAESTSNPSDLVRAGPPVNLELPAVSGNPESGSTLLASMGEWGGTGPLSFELRWLRCTSAGADCAPLGTAASSLALTGAEVGATLRVEVTARNAQGAASATSAHVGPVRPQPPTLLSAPVITGTARVGQTLAATEGTWAGSPPLSFVLQWQLCDAGGCLELAGANGPTYLVTAVETGLRLRVSVQATNAAGTATGISDPTAPVLPLPPANLSPPTVSGLALDGQTLTASPGTWSGGPAFTYQWQRCDAAGQGCGDLAAAGVTYVLGPADVGSTVRVGVAGSNGGGGAPPVFSAVTPVVQPQAPTAGDLPVISGTPIGGETLTATGGTWTGTPVITYAYQWRRCDASGASCAAIAGAIGSTYTLGGADHESTLRVMVTATNAGGSASVTSAQTALVPKPPSNGVLPAISGSVRVGQTLTATAGTWTGTPEITYAYRWRRCEAVGTPCVDVPGAASPTYTLAVLDYESTIRVVVTATNAGGSASVASAQTTLVPRPPVNGVLPAISGNVLEGQTLTATTGTWTGTPTITHAYQWRRCDAGGAGCSDITGATAATYTLAMADYESTIRVDVTATNAGGSSSVTSAPTALVPRPPSNGVLPAIAGDVLEGATLTASAGTWTGTPTIAYTYQWRRCDEVGTPCVDIAGATGPTYTLAVADHEQTIRVVVTATNAGGSASVTSAPTTRVPRPPSNGVPPAISGVVLVGETLTATPGTWTGTPTISYAYKWLRCDAAGTTCIEIPGAAGTSYALVAADYGKRLQVEVTASNAGGSVSATSAVTSEVPQPPANSVAPEVSGVATDGHVLSATEGTWTGTAPIVFAYQWKRCDVGGGACSEISGAVGWQFTLSAIDVGATLRCAVTATNGAGTSLAETGPSAVVSAAPPTNTVVPVVSGLPTDGEALATSSGTWSGTEPITFTYQWLRCDGTGAGCSDIVGAVGPSHTLAFADVGRTLRVRVRATNAAAWADVESEPVGPVAANPPGPLGAPVISGTATQGQTLSASTGSWSGTMPFTYAYQWKRCDGTGDACDDLPGETAAEYLLQQEDVDATVRVEVTAGNAAGSAAGLSEPSARVAGLLPANTSLPVVTGVAQVAATLSVGVGTWSGSTPLSFTYQWQHSSDGGATWAIIGGATGATYAVDAAYATQILRAQVTATNSCGAGCGSASAFSLPTSAVTGGGGPGVPSLTSEPFVTGSAVVGSTLYASPGSWSGAPTSYAFQWQYCLSADPTSCFDLPGATARFLTLSPAEEGRRLRIQVVATNANGSSVPAWSPLSAPIVGTATGLVGATPSAGPLLPVPDNDVYDVLRVGDRLFLGGLFRRIGYPVGRGAVLSTSSGRFLSEVDGALASNAFLYAVAPDGQGGWYIGGTFSRIGGVSRSNAAHLLADGSVDPAWNPAPNGRVLAIATDGATVFLGGQFTSLGPTARTRFAGVDAVTGALRSWTASANADVNALAVGNGKVYLGGKFTTVAGSTRNRAAAIVAATGALDPWSPSFDDEVLTLASSGSSVVAGGRFASVTVNGDMAVCPRLCGLAAMSPGTVQWGGSSSPNAPVNSLAISGSTVFLGGDFTTLGAEPRSYAGAVGLSDGALLPWAPEPDASVAALAVGEDGTVYLGGSFKNVRGTPRTYLGAVDPAGGVTSWAPEPDKAVRALAVAGEELFAAGFFELMNSVPRGYFGAIDLATRTVVEGTPAADDAVHALASAGGLVYLGGDFMLVGGEARNRLAAIDAQTFALQGWSPLASWTVREIVPVGTDVVLGGGFTSVNAQTRYGIASVTAAGTGSLNPLVLDVTTTDVYSLLLDGDTLYFGGSFSNVNSLGRNRLAAASLSSGAVIAGFDPDLGTAGALSKVVLDGSTLYLAGGFSSVGGTARAGAAAIDASSGALLGWDPGAAGSVRTVAVLGDHVYLGGSLTSVNAGAATRACLAAVDRTSGAVRDWVSNPGETTCLNAVSSLKADGATLWASGAFLSLGGRPEFTRLARFGPEPSCSVRPAFSGTFADGESVSVSDGTWDNGPSTYAYQWRRCEAFGADCADIPGATGSSYTLGPDDVDQRLRVVVTATNAYGSTRQETRRSALVVANEPPVNTAPPTISGTPGAGNTLTAAPGTWERGPKPYAYAYQWKRCDGAGAGCLDIAGETGATYTIAMSDHGAAFRVEVIASNSAGSSPPAVSGPTGAVDNAPVLVTAPTITSGYLRIGSTVAVTAGTWANGGSNSYQWRLCDPLGNGCVDIAGATGASRTALVAEKGRTFRVRVTNTNAYGSASVETAASSQVVGATPTYAGPAGVGSGTGGQAVITLTTPVSAGDSIIVAWSASGTSPPTGITIAGYGSCTASTHSVANSSANLISGVGWCLPLTQDLAASTNLTVSFAAGSSVIATAILAPGVTGRDFASGTFSNSANPTTYNATASTSANELLVAVVGSDANRSVTAAGDSFTLANSQSGSAGPYRHTSLYRQVSATGVYQASATLSNSADYSIVIVGFR